MRDTGASTQFSYRTGFLKAAFGDLDNCQSPSFRQRFKRENVICSAQTLYHYTTLAGFQGIVRTGGFWASDSRYMNDAEENVHGRKLALKVIQHRIERTRVTCFPEILKSVAEKLSREARIGHLVACFSTSRDSLEQWRGYGGSAGVCLAVNGLTGHSEISTKVSHEATKSNTPVFVAPDQVPLEVQYRWRRKATILLSVIGRFERQYELDRSAMPERWPHDHDEQYVEYLYDTLMHYILILKNDAFEKENEARIVLPYSAIKKFRSGLQFRPSNLGLIPYVCTGDHLGNTGQMPIKEVIVGPSAHKDLIAESITTFLEHMGYRDVPVSLSTVPFRS